MLLAVIETWTMQRLVDARKALVAKAQRESVSASGKVQMQMQMQMQMRVRVQMQVSRRSYERVVWKVGIGIEIIRKIGSALD